MKTFKLHFRYRDTNGELHDEVKTVETTSKKKAKEYGRQLEIPEDKYWFKGLLD